jgi:nucleobase:cation symporter-1, NCS1 family
VIYYVTMRRAPQTMPDRLILPVERD